MRQRGHEALFLELRADPIGDVRDSIGFALTRLLEPRSLLLAQFGEVERPLAILLRMRLEDYTLDLVYQAIGDAFC